MRRSESVKGTETGSGCGFNHMIVVLGGGENPSRSHYQQLTYRKGNANQNLKNHNNFIHRKTKLLIRIRLFSVVRPSSLTQNKEQVNVLSFTIEVI